MDSTVKFRQLRAFVEAMEASSFTLAAQRMEVSQPSFSALIKELERGLSVTLFERTTRRCVPTDAALAFYERLRDPLMQVERACGHARDIGSGAMGRLRLAALPSIAAGAMTRKLTAFQRSHPGITITLLERRHDQQVAAVLRGEVEFGICSMSAPNPGLSFQSLYVDRLLVVTPENHPLVGSQPTWQSLQAYPLVLVSSGQAEEAMRTQGVNCAPVCDVEQAFTALAMVRLGMGITVLSSSIIPDLATAGLAYTPIHGPKVLRSIGVIRRRNTRLSKLAAEFVRTLRDMAPPKFADA